MKLRFPRISSRWYCLAGAVVLIGFGWGLRDRWFPAAQAWASKTVASNERDAESADDHAGHDHGHAGHDEATSLELSDQARRNIGLKTGEVRLQNFARKITIPAVVVERPGRTKLGIAAPLTGIVADVQAVEGEAVAPGRLLFTIQLTHEDLVQAQTDFLKTLEAIDVENREIDRLQSITSGAVAGKVILERQYEKQKLEGLLRAQRQALLLHGLSDAQVEKIVSSRLLLRELQVTVPLPRDGSGPRHLAEEAGRQTTNGSRPAASSGSSLQMVSTEPERPEHPLVISRLNVQKGQFVQAGDLLCELADLNELYIEGKAFEQDAEAFSRAAREQWEVDAVPETYGRSLHEVAGLQIAYVANQVEAASRALHVYVRLPNAVTAETVSPEGQRFLSWKYKPGQRMQLRVPVESWQDVIVLPVDAVAQDGAESFVYTENGDHFDRQPVHVKYRDQFSAVVANDGSLFPGDVVALSGAHQLQMALKNKAGGGVDPHAGHNH